MYGYTKEEMIGLSVSEILHDEVKVKMPELLKEENISNVILIKLQNKKKNGMIFPVEIHSKVIEINGETLRCVVVHNLTERIKP